MTRHEALEAPTVNALLRSTTPPSVDDVVNAIRAEIMALAEAHAVRSVTLWGQGIPAAASVLRRQVALALLEGETKQLAELADEYDAHMSLGHKEDAAMTADDIRKLADRLEADAT